MKKRNLLIVGVLVFAVLMITACANSGQQKPSTTGGENVVNPMVQYTTAEEVAKKLGYDIGMLPHYTKFEIKESYIIDNKTADLRYTRADKAEATVRTEKNATYDISGVQNATYTKANYNGHEYFLGHETADKTQVAYFTKEDNGATYTYSMSATGMEKEDFLNTFITLMDFVYN